MPPTDTCLDVPRFDRSCNRPSSLTEFSTAAARSGAPGQTVTQRVRVLPCTGTSAMAGRCALGAATAIGLMMASSVTAASTLASPLPARSHAALELRSGPRTYATSVDEAAARFALPARWIQAVIEVESGGNARALSSAGAMGLMQLMPRTWDQLRRHYGLGADPFDSHDNIMAGTAYLRMLYDRFGVGGAFAAYNAGSARFEAYLQGRIALRAETRDYRSKLRRLLPDLPLLNAGAVAATANSWQSASLFASTSSTPSQKLLTAGPEQSDRYQKYRSFALAPHAGGLFVAIGRPAP